MTYRVILYFTHEVFCHLANQIHVYILVMLEFQLDNNFNVIFGYHLHKYKLITYTLS